MNRNLSRKIEQLVEASFSVRDELYAAAKTLDDERRSNVCKQLAAHLAGHAIELLTANGEVSHQPRDTFAFEAFFQRAKNRDGEAEVLRIAENCERPVKEVSTTSSQWHPKVILPPFCPVNETMSSLANGCCTRCKSLWSRTVPTNSIVRTAFFI